MRILVTGSRTFNDKHMVYRILDDAPGDNHTIVSGGARGADNICEEYAEEVGWGIELYEADWEKHGKKAGYIRNRDMVMSNPDICYAFIRTCTCDKNPEPHYSHGAQLTIDLCNKHNIPVQVYVQD